MRPGSHSPWRRMWVLAEASTREVWSGVSPHMPSSTRRRSWRHASVRAPSATEGCSRSREKGSLLDMEVTEMGAGSCRMACSSRVGAEWLTTVPVSDEAGSQTRTGEPASSPGSPRSGNTTHGHGSSPATTSSCSASATNVVSSHASSLRRPGHSCAAVTRAASAGGLPNSCAGTALSESATDTRSMAARRGERCETSLRRAPGGASEITSRRARGRARARAASEIARSRPGFRLVAGGRIRDSARARTREAGTMADETSGDG